MSKIGCDTTQPNQINQPHAMHVPNMTYCMGSSLSFILSGVVFFTLKIVSNIGCDVSYLLKALRMLIKFSNIRWLRIFIPFLSFHSCSQNTELLENIENCTQ